MPWKTILVPHDFSSCANQAAALARDVARAHGARLVLLHAAKLPFGLDDDTIITPEGGGPIPAGQFALGGARERLEDLVERMKKDGVEVTYAVTLGDPVDEILRAAKRENADLIVMGTNGRTGLSAMVVGSVAEKVVRQAPVPVMTLRAADDE